ncbi:MAG TPA: 1,4-alpha-glucan branching protein GlgB [Rhizomicrobium sp.]|nr:1,4-alpha-glucan branching protein GlgB [Rhizomicrobium sp.]
MPDREPFVDLASREAFWRSFLEDPFSVRGLHQVNGVWVVRSYQPGASGVELVDDAGPPITMTSLGGGFFYAAARGPSYRLRIHWPGAIQETEDPYRFGPILGDLDLHLFSEGTHWALAEKFGAVHTFREGVPGVSFAVWAPNARRVSVVGGFNIWDGRRHPMRHRHDAGVWELFIPHLEPGEFYKYEIVSRDGRVLPLKADPIARATEHPPGTASIVAAAPNFLWRDARWMAKRRQTPDAAIAIYEVHAASWMRPQASDTGVLSWDGLAERLIPYVKKLGFTHIELLPVMEHPFAGSWGYQPLSQFAPSSRYGSPRDFARFIDRCHQAELGVILDWVPAHFPSDAYGLSHFDGTALYEHADPREGFHPDWNTCVYNLGRREVQGFLIASALWWLNTFHADGLRVDAVASMLYRDYSRKQGEWIPNRYGGRENLEAIDFLKRLNNVVAERAPGAIMVAEESTAWPQVSAPAGQGGLGFSYKWNMGWMHDTLDYLSKDPIYRGWHHHEMTFGLLYAFSERFVLPLSHDEVVHGKGSLYGKIPGDKWQKLATLRAYFAFMWTHPGKKLLFMGGEFAQVAEWNHDTALEWHLLDDGGHRGVQKLVGDLNRLYRREGDLHLTDSDPNGFRWLAADDSANSVYSYARGSLVAVVNMTPVPRHDYRLGVPRPGLWREILNTDSAYYGGSNIGNDGLLKAQAFGKHGLPQSLALTLPPLGALILKTG